jgi:serine/threonine protein kinase
MEVGKTDWEKEINQRLIKNNFYSEKELLNILIQLVKALNYLQKNNISHRDIKAQNVLVFSNNVYKLADFGEAKKFDSVGRDILNTLRGTELYMSPILFYGLQRRIFDLKHNTYKSDVFSLGMCVLFAATLKIKVLCKIREFNNDKKVLDFLHKMLKERYSEKFINLIALMLKLNEDDRVDFIELEKILNEEFGED